MTRRSTQPRPIVVRPATAAAMLDCSRGFIYKLIDSGDLGRIQIADTRTVRIPIADVFALLDLAPPTEHDRAATA